MNDTQTRPALPGERCTCGRQATEVFITADHGDVGYCGRSDGGQKGPCVFCGAPRHVGRCPDYRLRADDAEGANP